MKQKYIYRMSFTTGGLFLKESVDIIRLYKQLKSWQLVKEIVFEKNLLQYTSKSSIKRVYKEIHLRLVTLDPVLQDLLIVSNLPDQQAILWVAVCKAYEFIQDFAVEVLREKYLIMNYQLTEDDYIGFYNAKADWYPLLDEYTKSTKKRQKSTLFRIMKEAGLLSTQGTILPLMPTKTVLIELYKNDPKNITFLTISDTKAQELMQYDK